MPYPNCSKHPAEFCTNPDGKSLIARAARWATALCLLLCLVHPGGLASSAYAAESKPAAASEPPPGRGAGQQRPDASGERPHVVVRMIAARASTSAEQELLVASDRVIHLVDGRELHAAELKPGDAVWLEGGTRASIQDVAAAAEPAPSSSAGRDRVIGTVRLTTRHLVELRWAGETLSTTPDHAFFIVDRGWVPAAELRPGDQAVGSAGPVRLEGLDVREVPPFAVFNLLVERTHAYRVGRAGLLVHNGCIDDFNKWELVKAGPPPTYRSGTGYLKSFKKEADARRYLAVWQRADELGLPVPQHKMFKTNHQPPEFAVYTEMATGEFFQLSKRGHSKDVVALVKDLDHAAKARVRRALQAAYASGLTDTQFFLNPHNPSKPIQFIDINLKGRPYSSEAVGGLLDALGWPRRRN